MPIMSSLGFLTGLCLALFLFVRGRDGGSGLGILESEAASKVLDK